MPEQPTLSIKVTVTPQVADGLHSRVQKVLAGTASERQSQDGGKGRTTIVNNTHVGDVRGTLFQIGNVEGKVTHHDR